MSIKGKKIVFTGKMSKTRTQMKKDAKAAGADVLRSISEEVDFLVCGVTEMETTDVEDAEPPTPPKPKPFTPNPAGWPANGDEVAQKEVKVRLETR